MTASPAYLPDQQLQPVTVTTDSEGQFAFTNLADAEYHFEVENTAPANAVVTKTPEGGHQIAYPGAYVPPPSYHTGDAENIVVWVQRIQG